jgi:NodT family efflux transporter outer membrane factor (OMF) lipoprotein
MRHQPLSNRHNALALSLLTAILSGCASVGPDYVKPELPLPAHWSTAQSTASREDLAQWWQRLRDPQLSSLIEKAVRLSPDMRSAEAKLREARARRDLAGGNRFPTVSASLSGSRSKSSAATGSGTTANLFSAGFDASWEPDVFGGQRRALEAAQADLQASRANLHDVQVSLAAEVALNYVELRSYQARLAIARDNLDTQSETLQITDWRQQAGLATALDVEQARTNLEQTRATIPVLNTSRIAAENRLAILLGKPPAALHDQLATPVPLPGVPDEVAVGIPADTLRQRPDVRAAERNLAAATARVGEQTAALYPNFSLSGSLGWKALTVGALGDGGTAAASLLGSIAQTLFDGGRIRSSIRIQTAVQEQALAAYQKTVLTALEDVENALATYGDNRQRQTALRRATQSARNAAQIARQRYESGLIDFQNVLDAERSRLSAEDNLASAEAEGLTSLISLYKALGGGWSETADTVAGDTQTSSESKRP